MPGLKATTDYAQRSQNIHPFDLDRSGITDIDGTVDSIVLCARPIGGSTNVDIEASIGWREIV